MQMLNRGIVDRDLWTLESLASCVLTFGVINCTDSDHSKVACTICNTGETDKTIINEHRKSDQHLDNLITILKQLTIKAK